jgi:hypothetical protein
MAAPERFADKSDSSCTAGAVHTWPLTSFTALQKCGRFSNRPLGSSAFRPSTTSTVSMSLTGSRFSSESAPRPFHDGIRERGGTIYRAALPSDEWQVQATKRTHLIHRPARDIIPTAWWSSSVLLLHLILHGSHAATTSRVQRNSVPSIHIRCRITANRRASATIAFFIPRCLAICIAQAVSQDHLLVRVSMTWAAS